MVYLNQQIESNRKLTLKNIWGLCSKYSKVFEKNIDNKHLNTIVNDSYKNFVSNIKSMKLIINYKTKYMQIWKTLINTIRNNNDINSTRIATNQFNYYIYINSLKNN